MKRKPVKIIEPSIVYASASQTLDGGTPESIVYLPKGEWKITPMVNGKADSIEVLVDADAATILQESLTERMKDPVRPHAAFDHKPGPASFLPKTFRWDDEKGVILDIEWTKSGQEAVAGKDYSYFSPTFLLRDRKVVGLPKDGEIGSLTNNPAFRKIQRIAASADGNSGGKMSKVAEKLVELKVITAQQANEAQEGDEDLVIRAIDGMHSALVMAQRANELLKADNTSLQLQVQEVRKSEAEQIIQAAVEEGKIPAKDQETIEFFKEQYLAHPEQTKKVLASLAGNTALGKPIIDVKAGEGRRGGGMSSAELIQAQKNAIAVIQESNPNISFDTAFNKAKVQHPELFVEA